MFLLFVHISKMLYIYHIYIYIYIIDFSYLRHYVITSNIITSIRHYVEHHYVITSIRHYVELPQGLSHQRAVHHDWCEALAYRRQMSDGLEVNELTQMSR